MSTPQSLSLGQFVKLLSAKVVLSESDDADSKGDLPFRNEKAWHLLFYRLKKVASPGRPEFLDDLFFDWDGRYPKCRQLSEYLHALHWNASLSAANPRYEQLRLPKQTAEHWAGLEADADEQTKTFVDKAVGLAKEAFARAS